jgi:hypothetical protein
MRKILLLVSIISLVGCANEPMSVEVTGKDNKFEIEFLFEKDGVKMYRFYDASHYHYFTTRGDVTSIQTNGETVYHETIETK